MLIALLLAHLKTVAMSCSLWVVSAYGVMGHYGGPIELFLVSASVP